MNKMIAGVLSLSTLALVSAAPLNVYAMPLQQGQGAPLLAGRDRDYDDYRYDDRYRRRHYDDNYALFCRRRSHHRWRNFGQYSRRFSALRAKYEYEWRGFDCYISRY
jgi:hypothetical protein